MLGRVGWSILTAASNVAWSLMPVKLATYTKTGPLGFRPSDFLTARRASGVTGLKSERSIAFGRISIIFGETRSIFRVYSQSDRELHCQWCASLATVRKAIRCRRFCRRHKKSADGLGKSGTMIGRKPGAPYADLRELIFTSPRTSSAASKMRQWRECERR